MRADLAYAIILLVGIGLLLAWRRWATQRRRHRNHARYRLVARDAEDERGE